MKPFVHRRVATVVLYLILFRIWWNRIKSRSLGSRVIVLNRSSKTIFLAQKLLGGIVMGYNHPEDVLSYLFCSQPDDGKKIKIASARSFDAWWLWCHFPAFLAFNNDYKTLTDKTLNQAVVYDDLNLSSLTLCNGQVDLEGAENVDDPVTCFGKQKPGENLEQTTACKLHIRHWIQNLNFVLTVTQSKIKVETITQIKSRIWKMKEDKYANILAKIQDSAVFRGEIFWEMFYPDL